MWQEAQSPGDTPQSRTCQVLGIAFFYCICACARPTHTWWSFKELAEELTGDMGSHAYQNSEPILNENLQPFFPENLEWLLSRNRRKLSRMCVQTACIPCAVFNILKGSHVSHMLSELYFQTPLKAWVKRVKSKFWIFCKSM